MKNLLGSKCVKNIFYSLIAMFVICACVAFSREDVFASEEESLKDVYDMSLEATILFNGSETNTTSFVGKDVKIQVNITNTTKEYLCVCIIFNRTTNEYEEFYWLDEDEFYIWSPDKAGEYYMGFAAIDDDARMYISYDIDKFQNVEEDTDEFYELIEKELLLYKVVDETYLEKASDGNWYYYVNGKIDRSYTGLVKYKSNWVFVNKGKLDASYTGLVKYKANWVYVNKGKLDASYTGLVKYKSNWVYVNKGKLDASYTGLVKYKSTWVYVCKGKLDATYTGMAKNQYGWWYVTNGKLDLTFTGIAKNAYGTWYLQKGKLDLTFSGKVTVGGKKYTIKNGKVS